MSVHSGGSNDWSRNFQEFRPVLDLICSLLEADE